MNYSGTTTEIKLGDIVEMQSGVPRLMQVTDIQDHNFTVQICHLPDQSNSHYCEYVLASRLMLIGRQNHIANANLQMTVTDDTGTIVKSEVIQPGSLHGLDGLRFAETLLADVLPIVLAGGTLTIKLQ